MKNYHVFIIFFAIILVIVGIYLLSLPRQSHNEPLPSSTTEKIILDTTPSDYESALPETLTTDEILKMNRQTSDKPKPHYKESKHTDPYSIGYDDGYEAGYDDGSNGYHSGEQYDTSASLRSTDRRSYLKGYRLGYSEGYESGQYDYDDVLEKDELEY